MKILINVPSFKVLGGVSNHFIGLKPFWSENVKYNVVGKRSMKKGNGIFWLPLDIIVFLLKLIIFRPNIVLLNPSLNRNAIVRDFIFLRISTFFHFNTAIMVHGFDWDYANKTDWKWLSKNFNRAILIFVLAKSFKAFMENKGVTTPIHLTTTKVDDRLISNFDINCRDGKINNILFLARIEKAKGIYITIDTFNLLKRKYPYLKLSIIGDGTELENVKKYIKSSNIPDIRITGALYGNDLIKELKAAQLSFSPSYYGEGMPTAVLETMAFGMPVFTRNVGGLPDFFENGEMGCITDSLAPNDYAAAMIPFLENAEYTKKVSRFNYEYARKHFMASRVATLLEKELQIITNK